MSYTPVEQAILVDLLIYGDNKAENIANSTGYHRNSISSKITPMAENGLLRAKGGGVYELTDDGTEAARGLVRSGVNPYQSD